MRTHVSLVSLLLAGMFAAACGSDPSVVRWETPPGSTGASSGTGGTGPNDEPNIDVKDETGGTANPVPAPVCGNGVLEPGEFCDDANTLDGDGCSRDCTTQDPTFTCANPGVACVKSVVCGNGVLEGTEACDDGGKSGGDGCSEDCSAQEAGWACTRPGKPCVRLPSCGNGLFERGEACDDGNPQSGDGCSGTEALPTSGCQREAGFWCSTPGQPCVQLQCGDGKRTPDEQCDDGNGQADDGCSRTCTTEPGWRCSLQGCRTICGDGQVKGDEACDDGNPQSGDGCSAACRVEPLHSCTGTAPSSCVSTIECGDGKVQGTEICDPPGTDGCLPGCRGFAPYGGVPPVCGNNIIQLGETCDPPDIGAGCSASCQTEPGFACPRAGTCLPIPVCGDGALQAGEECDVGPVSSAGCVDCKMQSGWECYGAGPTLCEQPTCGDGIRSPSEECDDHKPAAGDGCNTLCKVEAGWICPEADKPCIPQCGDKKKVGLEKCDDGNRKNSDGCNAACVIEPGFDCPTVGAACVKTVCGNGAQQAGEGCDDSNTVAGDGCGPTCQDEPTVKTPRDLDNPVMNVTCGDGMVTGTEKCDDGNTTAGDGCSATCAKEAGFTCQDRITYPPHVDLAVTYRDFKADAEVGGHPDFEWEPNPFRRGIPGPVCTTATSTACGAAPGVDCPAGSYGVLDLDGKPVFHLEGDPSERGRVWSADSYYLWYRNANTKGTLGSQETPSTIAMWNSQADHDSLRLTQVGATTSDKYEFSSTSHFPLDDRGFDVTPEGSHNYHFTTELRYFFQYRGGETLNFRGDDDVWVFINGRLAVDIGGVHGALYGRVVLGDDGDGNGTDSNCSVHGNGSAPADCTLESDESAASDTDDKRFNLKRGSVYEIVLFHAERHTTASNFRLTLQGFLAPRSYCSPDCGDGLVKGWEVCDDGTANSDTVYGKCNKSCTGRSFCGDGTRQGVGDTPAGPEQCDDGRNLTVRSAGSGAPAGECGPGCTLPSRCGDGILQSAYEECDAGLSNNDGAYGPAACKKDCTLGAYCGDGVTTVGKESCDHGALNGKDYGPNSCGYDCQLGARCGDGIRNGTEECDGTPLCRTDCTVEPVCGDGIKSNQEPCDYGQFATDAYGSCTTQCQWGPHCGDAQKDEPYEECDLGTAANVSAYNGCTATCTLGPRCGDGTPQESAGEQCDNGFNDDAYAYSSTACAPGCVKAPYCGDSQVHPSFELCDNGPDNSDTAYNGCNSHCEWGPYCGDGHPDPEETCDDGPRNTLYSSTGQACSPDCQPAPYCGDGVRNGPEQCDLGSTNNTGAYGGCNANCSSAPRCGDREIQVAQGEQCDDGPIGSLSCTVECKLRSQIY